MLIPLVKTSAGGLPYDVKLYLARCAATPLGALTRIAPPAIELVGIDVQRTTWSLRLPAGYSYQTRGAGGNMSPIAGQAEKMAIEIDASIDQLKRYGESNAEMSSGLVIRNWQTMNDKITRQRENVRTYIEGNKSALASDDYSRLNSKLQEQVQKQTGIMDVWKSARERNLDQSGDNNINGYVGQSAVSSGLAESARDAALANVPDFFEQANKGNIAAVQSEAR